MVRAKTAAGYVRTGTCNTFNPKILFIVACMRVLIQKLQAQSPFIRVNLDREDL